MLPQGSRVRIEKQDACTASVACSNDELAVNVSQKTEHTTEVETLEDRVLATVFNFQDFMIRKFIYRDITIHFEIADATDHFDFEFIGSLNQSMNDESWGIDNIRIDAIDPVAPLSVPSVPTPASITLLGAGLGLMGSKRRR